MTPEPDLTAAVAEVNSVVLGDSPVAQILDRVADIAVASLSGVGALSVTQIDGGRPRTVVCRGTVAALLDERQYADGFGPCLDAARRQTTVLLDGPPSVAHDYPGFAREANRLGVTGTVSVGMSVAGGPVGALNLYRTDAAPFSPQCLAAAQRICDQSAVALANATTVAQALARSDQMTEAMSSRAVIEQAKGILAVTLRCPPEEAFAHLKKLSQESNKKLRDIAAEVVALASRGRLD